jgi:predicted GIY-YIG superfamily endonuclease
MNPSKYYNYILYNKEDLNKTYVGMTNNIKRRIRQHNGLLVGGAKYTSKYSPTNWNYLLILEGCPDNINSFQCEWRFKYPNNNRKKSGKKDPVNKLNSIINLLLTADKWTNSSIHNINDLTLTIYVEPVYKYLFDDHIFSPNIQIKLLDNLVELH